MFLVIWPEINKSKTILTELCYFQRDHIKNKKIGLIKDLESFNCIAILSFRIALFVSPFSSVMILTWFFPSDVVVGIT